MTKPIVNWTWSDGIGHLPLCDNAPIEYGESYFDNYAKLAETRMSADLTNVRCRMVEQFAGDRASVLDVGIGCGAFITEMCRRGHVVKGTDVNAKAKAWLKLRELYWDHKTPVDVMTMWDVLEHIEDPAVLFVVAAPIYICVSMPIYMGERHALKSKHLKPGEHCWYFTESGLIRYMGRYGFECIHTSSPEVTLGREDIQSFVFKNLLR